MNKKQKEIDILLKCIDGLWCDISSNNVRQAKYEILLKDINSNKDHKEIMIKATIKGIIKGIISDTCNLFKRLELLQDVIIEKV